MGLNVKSQTFQASKSTQIINNRNGKIVFSKFFMFYRCLKKTKNQNVSKRNFDN